MGMGVNFVGLNTTIHYGAPRHIDDYFQESGQAGCGGEQATSIYWIPADAPLHLDSNISHDLEVAAVRRYLENTSMYMLSCSVTDTALVNQLPKRDPNTCCDTCKSLHK